MITKTQLIRDLTLLKVTRGDILNVKASLKSIGPIQGSAKTLIEALQVVVGEEGTIVFDSFVKVYPVILNRKFRRIIIDRNSESYAGSLANFVIHHPQSIRSNHPVQKFTALGRQASELLDDHGPHSFAYEPFLKMAQMGGKNLNIGSFDQITGVGTTHVAIGILGFRQKRIKKGVYYRTADGKKKIFIRNWAAACHQGMNNFLPEYKKEKGTIIQEGKIGNAPSTLTSMKKTLEVELKVLKENPQFFMCNDPDCMACRCSWEFSDANEVYALMKQLFKGNGINIRYLLRLLVSGEYVWGEGMVVKNRKK